MKNIFCGDFKTFGAVPVGDGVVFTFVSKNKPSSVLLYDVLTKELLDEIIIPKEYYRGTVCSVKVSGINFKEVCYRYKSGNVEYVDSYASYILGRNKWGKKKSDIYSGIYDFNSSYKQKESLAQDDLIIYHLHMRGISMDKSIDSRKKGNYLGLIDALTDIKKMGFNAISMFPIYDFDECIEDNRINYWGYADEAPFYLAPKSSYFNDNPVENTIALINEMHKNKLFVITEFCFFGNKSSFEIVEILKHWAFNYDVDGFKLIGKDIPIKEITDSAFLKDKYLIFETDYGDDSYVANDSFLYSLRKLQNHMDGAAFELSENIIRKKKYINYPAAYNGFTLYDSYAYCDRHNEDNLESNNDGNPYSCSVNMGIEGPTKDKRINNKRLVAIKNALLLTMLSRPCPLICAGDEMLNSNKGNNNPFCQDNKIGWVNYNNSDEAQELKDYVKNLIKFRKAHPAIYQNEFKMVDYKKIGMPDISFHGREPWLNMQDFYGRAMGILYCGEYTKNPTESALLLFNFYNDSYEFTLPVIKKKDWYLLHNTNDFAFRKKKYNKDTVSVPGNSVTLMVIK